jgi:hypothetical protein
LWCQDQASELHQTQARPTISAIAKKDQPQTVKTYTDYDHQAISLPSAWLYQMRLTRQ